MVTIAEALDTALALHGAGQLDEAATWYERILAADPEHSRVLYFAGTLFCQLGRTTDGRDLLERAVVQEPGLAPAHANLAKIHSGAGDWTAASVAARRVVALVPADWPAWELIGAAAWQMGGTDAAIAALGHARRLDPQSDGGKLGLLLYERGRSRLDEGRSAAALPDLAAAAAVLPFDPDLQLAQITALIELGRNREAAALCERLLAWSPAEPTVLHNLGVALIHVGHGSGWLPPLRRADRLAPDNPQPSEALAAAFDRRDPVQARYWSSRALSSKLRAAAAEPCAPPGRRTAAGTLDVVSFSLWGNLEVYCAGAVENARRVPQDLPGWRCRFYHDETVPAHILAELAALDAELVRMPQGSAGRQGMFWRFFAADDPTVRRFLCRDCDSRMTGRELSAVREWLESGRPFHVMRDHIMHMEPVMGGMWGGTAGHLPPLRPAVERFVAARSARWNDQHFLADWLWPRIADRVLVHDELHEGMGRRFPEPVAAGGHHVGAKLFHLLRLPEMQTTAAAGQMAGPAAEAAGRHGRLCFPADDPHIGPSLDLLGEWLEVEAALCTGFLPAGALAVDADAGIGAHALAFARAVGTEGRVFAVEPSPERFRFLNSTLALNGGTPVVACRTLTEVAAALPDGAGPALIRATLRRADAATAPDFGDPALMDSIVRHRPVLYLRVAEEEVDRGAIAWLLTMGYRLWWHLAPVFNPANRNGCAGNRFPGLVTINILAVPKEREAPSLPLVAIDGPDSSWQAASWRLTCDGR